MNSEQIPDEAIEAASQALAGVALQAGEAWSAKTLARAALTAALPHLATHQPARVSDLAAKYGIDPGRSDAVDILTGKRVAPEPDDRQPARVLPSVEDARALDELPPGSVVRTASGDTWVCYEGIYGPRWVGIELDSDDYEVTVEHKQHWLYDALPLTVLHRPDASAPTVQEVRAEVAREIEADRPKHADGCRCGGCTRLRKDVHIARAAETEAHDA